MVRTVDTLEVDETFRKLDLTINTIKLFGCN